ncbi:MAG: cell division protein FtsA [Bacteroidales bacterium]|nr:cell division protein FtsA [Bacteroidales bacterium]
MEPKEYIAAIDLGSSKIVGMIGWKRPDNTLEVVAMEKIDSSTCIRRGTIHNLEDTSINVKHLLRKMENTIHPNKFISVYVGMGGQSIHTLTDKVKRVFGQEEIISAKIVTSINDECYNFDLDDKEVLEVVPNEYRIDDRKTEINPIGVSCEEIEANVKLIVGRAAMKETVARAIEDKSDVEVVGSPISQLAAASLLLSETDKMLGCALIDFGAGTTSVTIYKDGLFRHLAVIPFGGNVVTKDICSANLMESDAELLKTTYGSAILNAEAENLSVSANNGVDEAHSIELHTLNNIIEARMTEIVQNIWAQIESAGFAKGLGAGIYYTGGASQLDKIGDLIKSITKINAKKATNNVSIYNSTLPSEVMLDPAYAVVLGMLLSGTKNCVKIVHASTSKPATIEFPSEDEILETTVFAKHEEPKKKEEKEKEKKEKKKSKLFGVGDKMSTMFGNLFSDSENDDTAEMK